jgi:hypothetical protein
MQMVLVSLVAIGSIYDAAPALMAARAAAARVPGRRGVNATFDGWLRSVGRRVIPDPAEDVFDEDHLPRRPGVFDDRSFGRFIRNASSSKVSGSSSFAKRKHKRIALATSASTSSSASESASASASASASDLPEVIVVAKDGSGSFRTVQAAIDSLPRRNTRRVVVFVKKGVYTEKVRISSGRRFVTLKGESASLTTIEWGDTASTLAPGKKPLGTYGSASVAVEADNFVALDISFKVGFPSARSDHSTMFLFELIHVG